MVYKGVMTRGKMEVAVKTLKNKEDRVKFLQEAAIMGQFTHPNVVKMYGVITDGEPVSHIIIILLFVILYSPLIIDVSVGIIKMWRSQTAPY